MSSDQGPGDLDQFLNEYVHSYEELDALLLLHRTYSQRWTPEGVAGELKISEDSAARALEGLRVKGLIRLGLEAGSFYYEPPSPDMDAAITNLARFNREKRFAIVESMSRHAFNRMRHSVLHALVEGFRQSDRKKDRR